MILQSLAYGHFIDRFDGYTIDFQSVGCLTTSRLPIDLAGGYGWNIKIPNTIKI